MDYYCRS
ncbi:hypothetical protein R3I94_019542 [Phoxinus phoxinus]